MFASVLRTPVRFFDTNPIGECCDTGKSLEGNLRAVLHVITRQITDVLKTTSNINRSFESGATPRTVPLFSDFPA